MKIGMFGCGNMGSALAHGMRAGNPQLEFYCFTPSRMSAQRLAHELNGHFVEHLIDMPQDLDWYILGFKPQSLSEFNFSFAPNAKVLSMLAGTPIEKIKQRLKVENVARIMPNTPSALGLGANLFYAHFDCSELISALSGTGEIFNLGSEDELDTLTAFSGSGPALIFEFARLFEKHLLQLAPQSKEARKIIAQTFYGSATLLKRSLDAGVSPEELRDQVTSKKGVTMEALNILEKNNLDHIVGGAFNAAYKRTIELKKGI